MTDIFSLQRPSANIPYYMYGIQIKKKKDKPTNIFRSEDAIQHLIILGGLLNAFGMAVFKWVLPVLGSLSWLINFPSSVYLTSYRHSANNCALHAHSDWNPVLKHFQQKWFFPLKIHWHTNLPHLHTYHTLLSGVIIRKLAQWNLRSSLSLAPPSLFSQSLPHFSATFLIGFGKHLIAAVTPLHLHTACTLLFPINEHIDLSSARCISFSRNFWSACLSQKKQWLDEKCVPCL